MTALTQRVLIVMPAFNEEASVADVVREVQESCPAADVLVVDDGSIDDTSAVARAAGASVATLPFNLGVGGAMRTGFLYAERRGYDAVVQIDADGQHDPREVEVLLGRLAEADIVIGARFAGAGEYQVRGPRRWAMRILAVILSRITGAKLTDATSGFRACGPRAIALFAEHYPAEYLGDTIEALVIAARSECRVEQVGVSMRPRSGGRPSHNPLKSAVFLGRAMIALAVALMSPSTPAQRRLDGSL